MKRIDIIEKLIAEGFSEKTLAGMNDKELNLLSLRIINEQTLPYGQQKGSVIMKKDRVTPIDAKKWTDSGVNIEVKEEKKWIQKAFNKIEKKGTEGKCTGDKFGGPGCPEGSKAYNMAKNLRKINTEEKEINEDGPIPGTEAKLKVLPKVKTVPPGNVIPVGKPQTIGKPIPPSKVKIKSNPKIQIVPPEKVVLAKKPKSQKKQEVKEWVEKLIENQYHSLTTKDEIMELISIKLTEQAPEVAPAPVKEPKVKPEVEPRPEKTPEKTPDRRPHINPWDPKPGKDDKPKLDFPEFLTYDELQRLDSSSLSEAKINKMVSNVLRNLNKNG